MPDPRPLVIVKTGDTLQDLRAQRGDFEQWVAEGLGLTRLPLVVLDPRRGDRLPAPGKIAGAVVTGSHAMVSHRVDWSEATAGWLARGVAQGTPLLGICFGHQLLAHALGGTADDHPQGLEIGTVDVALTPAAAQDALFGGLPANFPAHVIHRQSALRLPEGAVCLAGSAREANHAFRAGDCAWGVQFHPEFDADAMRGYIDAMAAELPDAAALRHRVAPTPHATSLLARFGRLVEAREAQAPGAS